MATKEDVLKLLKEKSYEWYENLGFYIKYDEHNQVYSSKDAITWQSTPDPVAKFVGIYKEHK